MVTEPGKTGVVSHSVYLREHRVEGAYADFAFDLTTGEQNLVTYLMTFMAGSFLFNDAAENMPGIIADTISHNNLYDVLLDKT